MLLEHNIPVYKQLIDVLSNNNCACVVMGTGVGKSYVALEYLTQNKLTALVVSPRTSINESWEKLCGKKVDTITYQKLANIYKSVDYSFYDVIICDEVHHIGAPKWGEPIKFLIDSGKKVIGLTESSIRYTDGARDVATEFFHGNIVNGESVESAIEKQILNPVTYVGAMYNSDGLKKTIRGKIQSRLYAKLNLVLNKTPTVQEILKKNMPDGKRKGIIFASTINDIHYAIDFMHSVYPDVVIKFVHSKRPASYNAEVFDWFKKTKEGYICSVDMISEGVHIKGVNTLIMLRRTESLNLFNQQLGRCLDANSKEPAIIFDLVNNKYSIRIIKGKTRIKTNSVFESSKLNVSSSEQLIIKDYTKDIVEVLEEIKMSLEGKWTDEEKQILIDYYQKEKNKIIERLPRHTLFGCRYMASLLGLQTKRLWTEEEDAIIKTYYPSEGTAVCSRLPSDRDIESVMNRAKKLRIKFVKKHASSDEIKFIIDNYPKFGVKYCAEKLGRSEDFVKNYARRHGIKFIKDGHYFNAPWSKEDDDILIKYYSDEGYSVKKRLSVLRSEASISNRVRRLGLKKIIPWTNDELLILVDYYPSEGKNICSRLPGKSYDQIRHKAKQLGIVINKKRD